MSRNVAEHLRRMALAVEADPSVAPQMARQASQMLRSVPGCGPSRDGGAGARGPSFVEQFSEVHRPQGGRVVEAGLAVDKVLFLANIPALAPVGVGGAASAGLTLRFKSGPGYLVYARGSVIDLTAGNFAAGELERTSIEVEAFMNDGEHLFTDGEQAGFVRYVDLFPQGGTFWLVRHVKATDSCTFRFRNTQPAVGGHTLTPSLTFGFLRELG